MCKGPSLHTPRSLFFGVERGALVCLSARVTVPKVFTLFFARSPLLGEGRATLIDIEQQSVSSGRGSPVGAKVRPYTHRGSFFSGVERGSCLSIGPWSVLPKV